ncbi:unnamed protein product [Rhizoctonia solani]|uniref:Uncharacterized protein n=3 Tax=Rhizoctonia solani TaxID=456999 RepID=A0A8H3H924_9AGAM|nr:hypothetical protein RSOL_493210 [Rhizoctonia solani AG-3 Rhs1AP]KEP53902.1 hypothetical protein V565_024980 [Rhizoctonia solani 123E]CAE6436221.1 unnamed protein product [Rhizoctonia solani]CAE6507828.1 unnamed protein product [Rhizoctonia solani]
MIDFANRRFTIRLGRTGKPLKTGEHIARRTSTMGRKTSARRVSVRNSTALKRAPSGAGGLHRGASVHRSQSALRRGASVKRASSATRRNSKRISAIVQNGQLVLPEPASPNAIVHSTGPATLLTSPVTSPKTPKSFLSKLTSRFRGRSKIPKVEENHASLDLVTQGITDGLMATPSASNLAPVSPIQISPSMRSPSPGSRVTFVDTLEPTKSENDISNCVVEEGPELHSASPNAAHKDSSDLTPVVDDNGDDEGEWVDAEDAEVDPEPRKSLGIKLDKVVDPMGECSPAHDVPRHSGDPGVPVISPEVGPGVRTELQTEDQPKINGPSGFQTSLLTDLSGDTSGPGTRVSQWLADTPLVQVVSRVDNGKTSSGTSTPAKRESKRPRPPQIIVPTLSSNNPYRVPLPVSPSGLSSSASEVDPFRSLTSTTPALAVDSLNTEDTVLPSSPSILLTPALEVNGFDLSTGRKSSDTLAVDHPQIPLPPSPAPSSVFPSRDSEDGSPTFDKANIARANSMSTLGGRSLSTAPSTRGPATPTSMRIPGHPSMAHFSFGGPNSPSLNVEDWETGEEERRGRSLEVQDGKRRMRSVSPKLDAVLEGDESRRNSKASFEATELNRSSEDRPASALPLIEEDAAFGKKRCDDSESEHEDECGFYAFAERQMEEGKKAPQASAPKRSKTMSFLNVGFGKRKSAIGELPQSPPRSSTSSRLLGLPVSGPKRSSTLMAPSGGDRISRLIPTQRSSTLLAEPLSPREAVSPIMYTAGDIQTAAGAVEDDESRRLCEAAFMF